MEEEREWEMIAEALARLQLTEDVAATAVPLYRDYLKSLRRIDSESEGACAEFRDIHQTFFLAVALHADVRRSQSSTLQ